MMKIKNKAFLLLSILFFVMYFYSLFKEWFIAEGVRIHNGTLVLTSLFPLSVIIMIIYFISLTFSFFKHKTLYNYIVVLTLISLLILSIRLLISWGGISNFITFWFYTGKVTFLC